MSEESKPKRLCSEIQLFDLCAEEHCKYKDGRYCVNSEMLAKFEAISENDESMQDRFVSGEADEFEDYDDIEDEDGCFADLGDGSEDDDE